VYLIATLVGFMHRREPSVYMAAQELPADLEGYEEGGFDDAQVPDETERHYLTDHENERYWWFNLKPVTWVKKNQILSDCIEVREGGQGSLNVAEYYRQMMLAKTLQWSGGDQPLGTFLTGLRADLGEQVENWLPDPGAIEEGTEAEEGNSERGSEPLEVSFEEEPTRG